MLAAVIFKNFVANRGGVSVTEYYIKEMDAENRSLTFNYFRTLATKTTG